MAKTYLTRTLRVRQPSDPHMSYAVRRLPEGATQTFIASAPVVVTSGLVVEAADPVAAVFGIAVRDGQNVASGALAELIPIVDGLEFYANFLATGGGDNVLAAADLNNANPFQVEKNTVGGNIIWHAADASTTDACDMVSFDSDQQLANQVGSKVEAGDTNARCSFVFIDSIRQVGA